MLDVLYSPEMIAKAKAITEYATRKFVATERDERCYEICGLSYQYIKRIGREYKQPSNRTLMNLGYELFIKDTTTGILTPLEMIIKCDWNKYNPRANPTSIRISEDVLGMTSTLNG